MFDWEGYLRLAEELSKSKDNESHLRAAVSRAYYAAYNVARRYIEEEKPDLAIDGGSHQKIWNAFPKNTPGAKSIETGININGFKLQGYRVEADYRTHAKNFDRTALYAISLSKSIITSVSSLRRSRQSAR